ncbi:MAG TPA: ATP-binding protein [Acidimicrobiia bacterium]
MRRRLTIRTKLAATLAVPLAALASFAALQVRDAYNRSDRVRLQAGLATSATGPAGALNALETERDYEALRAIGAQNLVAPKDAKFSGAVTVNTDAALTRFRLLLGSVGGDAAGNYRSALTEVTRRLVQLRQQAEDHASKVATPANAKQAGTIFDGYTTLIGSLLDADQRSGATIDDAQLRSGVELLNATARQSDTESGIGVKVGLAAITRDPAAIAAAQRLADRQAQGDADLRVRADGPFERAMISALDAPLRKRAVAELQAAARDPLHANLETLLKVRPDSVNLLWVAQTNTASLVTERAHSLTSGAQHEEADWFAITLGSVMLAIALLWLTNRWITRPLRALADQAAAMAGQRLPAAVQEILESPVNESVVRPEMEPVRVHAGGEVHEVEVALNMVQDSAVSLAVEQATMRQNIADAYVNLGRRNQNLLSRQLEFITKLENDESDPETLEHLFRLDHLATRMRRNAESLLVLAGLAPPRTWSAPVAMGDVVRGALGEVEGYRRVSIRHVDGAQVDGTAAADVSHVIAELVENALSFSPPDAEVEVYGRHDDHGYVITIIDSGIGMHEEELERANALISSARDMAVAPSRFLGHYVVAQLAHRHGLTVHLAASPASGLTATIAVPTALLGITNAPSPEAAGAPAANDPATGEPERPVVALPRRDGATEPAPVAVRRSTAPITFRASPASASQPGEPVPELQLVAPLDEADEVDATAGYDATEEYDDTDDVPLAEPEPAPIAAPAPSARPRVGLGTFADLRGASVPPVRAEDPRPAQEATLAPDETAGAAGESTAPPTSAPAADPDRAPVVTPDRRPSFAEVAQAVDVVTGRPAPQSPFSEDLLPQRLPKRGRRSSRLETPWIRDRPVATAPESPVAPPAAAPPVAAASMPWRNGADESSVAPASAPVARSADVPQQDPAPAPSARGGERFAFFAAFRAAAEQAREEAGIDDRRGH